MEFLMELLLSCFMEGIEGVSTSRKAPKWLSYTCGVLLLLFYGSVFLLLFFVSFMVMKNHSIAGVFILIITLIMFILFMKKGKEIYQKIKR